MTLGLVTEATECVRQVRIKTAGDDRLDVLLRDPAEVVVAGLDAQVVVVAILDGDEFAFGNRADAVGAVEGRKTQAWLPSARR